MFDGVRLATISYSWTPFEVRRTAAARGYPWLHAETVVRMPLAESIVMLTLSLSKNNASSGGDGDGDGNGGGDEVIPIPVQFDIPFISRLYPEVEHGYECCSPYPASNSRNASDWEFQIINDRTSSTQRRSRNQSSMVQTGDDTVGAARDQAEKACTAVAFSTADAGNGVGFAPVVLSRLLPGGWSRATTTATLASPLAVAARLGVILAVKPSCAAAVAAAEAAAADFDTKWDAIPQAYESRWQDAFTPGNSGFGGHFPTLATDDVKLARTYYGSLMSMMLVNKQGVDWEYEVEKAPAYPAAGNCQGTYVHLPPRAHLYQPTAVESASPPFQLVGGKAEGSVSAKQFLGRTSTLLWKTGTGSIDSESGTIALRFSNSTAATSSPPTPRTGTYSEDCERIVWEDDGGSWVRVRKAGPFNLFVAAGALLGNTAFYLWDTSGASLLWTLLDPESIAVANNVFSSTDPLVKNACDYITLASSGTSRYTSVSACLSNVCVTRGCVRVRVGFLRVYLNCAIPNDVIMYQKGNTMPFQPSLPFNLLPTRFELAAMSRRHVALRSPTGRWSSSWLVQLQNTPAFLFLKAPPYLTGGAEAVASSNAKTRINTGWLRCKQARCSCFERLQRCSAL